MTDIPETVLASLAAPVARALPVIVSRIPTGPAAELGRVAVPLHRRARSVGSGPALGPAGPADQPAAVSVVKALQELGPLLAERLLAAAPMFWNVNALTRLSFAEDGQVLAGFEPGFELPEEAGAAEVPSVAAALEGLDFEDYRDKNGKGLVAVERFTGRGFTQQDLERIEDADIAYRISAD